MKRINNVLVKKSSIQGQGVFSLREYKAGNFILDIDDSHVVKRPDLLTKEQNEYDCDYLANGKVVLMQSPEKNINHSCDPTVYVKTIGGVRKIFAMKHINPGDELTFDYSINGANDGTFTCNCHSRICRGIYQGNFFKLPKETQLKYLPYLDDWFKEEHPVELEKLEY